MRWRRMILAALVPMAAGCSSANAAAMSSVTLDEYSIEVARASLEPGASLMVSNQGAFGHTLVVSDESGAVVAATGLIPPGESLELAADWEAGNYRFTCRIVVEGDDGIIVDHYATGMRADIAVAD